MMAAYKGTYSADDDKLRLYPPGDPDPGIRERAKDSGFLWSNKRQAFVAPKWTPEREDLLLELCGQIGDENGNLVGSAEPYSKCIATTEADKRRQEQARSESETLLKLWHEVLTLDQAEALANRDRLHVRFNGDSTSVCSVWSGLVRRTITLEEARNASMRAHEIAIARVQRWIDHHEKRLAHARALLLLTAHAGPNRVVPEAGGACQCATSPNGKWSYIRRVNKSSVTVIDTWEKGRTFPCTIPFGKLSRLMGAAEVVAARIGDRLMQTPDGTGFVLLGETTASNGEIPGQ